MSFAKLGAEIARDYAIDGVPASGAHNIIKTDLRDWMAEVESTATASVPAPSGGDDTTAIQLALDAATTVYFRAGTYEISDDLLPNDNQQIIMGPDVHIIQTTASKRIFLVEGKEDCWIFANGALLEGEGTYDGNPGGSWTGNFGSSFDRGIEFKESTRGGVVFPRIINCGNAGIAIVDSTGQKILLPHIEGTHTHGTPILSSGNFQNGILIQNGTVACNDIEIVSPDISGTAQGVLDECGGGIDYSDRRITVTSPNIHDITGQHAFYLTGGGITVNSPIMTNIELAGFKLQAGDANEDITGVTCTGAVGRNLGSNLFEIVRSPGFTGVISKVRLDGVGVGVGRGLAITGPVFNLSASLNVEDVASEAVIIQGTSVQDVNIDLIARNVGADGVLVTATGDRIRIRANIRDPNQNVAVAVSGIRVESSAVVVELIDPFVTDANGNMNYGLFNSVAGGVIRVRGSATFTGAADTAVRASGGLIDEWPTETTLQGINGAFHTQRNVFSTQPFKIGAQSVSTTPVVLWRRALGDETAYIVKALIVGKLSGTSERACYESTTLVYVDSGTSAIQGTPDEIAASASGSFAGVYAWGVSGNDILLSVHSGGVATYDWTAHVTVVAA